MGDNIYSLDKAMQKKKEKKQVVDDDVLLEAQKIEEENYDTAKDIRMQLGAAAVEQKQATEEVKRQGETLDAAKKAVVGVHREARKGEKLADDIEREGQIFCFRSACFGNLCSWFKSDSGDAKVEEILNKEGGVIDEPVPFEEERFDENQKEMVPGQNKTDKELNAILNAVRGIKTEAEVQGKEAERQKTVVKDISVVNEEAEKVIKRTDKHLKDIE